MRVKLHTLISLAILGFMILMIVAAIEDMRRGGSLDDLSADQIKDAVNGG